LWQALHCKRRVRGRKHSRHLSRFFRVRFNRITDRITAAKLRVSIRTKAAKARMARRIPTLCSTLRRTLPR
jgi:hypothetical protein